jgi:PmbA protein
MAKSKQLELAHWATKQATDAGADEAKVSVQNQRYVSLEYRERKIEKLEEATTNGLNLTLYLGGKYSSHRTSDLRKEGLEAFIRESVAMTKYLTEDKYRYLPEAELYKGRKEKDLGLADKSYKKIEAEKRHDVAKKVEAAALEAGGDKIISVTAGYYDSSNESTMVTSNGFEGTRRQTAFWAGAEVTAKDEGDKRPSDWWWQGGSAHDFVADPKMIGEKACGRALGRVGSGKIDTEVMPIVIENRATGRLLRWLSSGLYARNLQQKNSFLEGKIGEQIASEILTITDDPFVKRGQGSRLYDGEGITAKQMPVIEKGVLKNYYIDTYYGRKLEMAPTTGSPSNSVFAMGDKDQEGWMKELGRGILVTGFIGGNSNGATGDFSAGIYGFYFENGDIVKPVSEMNIAGNHLEFWKQLVGVGNDAYQFSSLRAPCLVFEKVNVAGA